MNMPPQLTSPSGDEPMKRGGGRGAPPLPTTKRGGPPPLPSHMRGGPPQTQVKESSGGGGGGGLSLMDQLKQTPQLRKTPVNERNEGGDTGGGVVTTTGPNTGKIGGPPQPTGGTEKPSGNLFMDQLNAKLRQRGASVNTGVGQQPSSMVKGGDGDDTQTQPLASGFKKTTQRGGSTPDDRPSTVPPVVNFQSNLKVGQRNLGGMRGGPPVAQRGGDGAQGTDTPSSPFAGTGFTGLRKTGQGLPGVDGDDQSTK